MMASMGPSFSPHPGGMQQHPGVPPGHPMAPGMAHNPSQPGAQPGGMPHQIHMGVSAAGGQVNPAALMGGMPPGAGPNAHAMQHLNPQQAHLFQQQQMNPMAFQNNPALQQQYHNQRLQALQQQQQQARQVLLAQQSGMYGGMPMGIPGMAQMTPAQAAQLAAMRNMRPQQAHNPAMIAQQMALQQQQQQMAQQQGQNPNQQGHMNPQLNLQQAQLQAAMQAQQQAQAQAQQQQAQHAQAQAQAQAQQQQGQPQPQPQQREQPQPPQQAGQPQQQPGQQPGPQPGQGGPQQNPAQQNPGQPQGPMPTQPNPQQQQQVQPQNPQQVQPQPMITAQQQQVANSIMQAQKREGMKGNCLLRLMQFSEHLSGFPGSKGKDDLSYWNEFVHRFFSPRGMFRYSIHVVDGEEQNDKQYEITFPALARYFHTHFDSGVKYMQLTLDKGTTDRSLPGDCHFIENTKSSLVYWFEGGSHLIANGTLRAQFDAEQKIELFEFLTTGHEEYISRKLVIQAAKPAHNWVKDWHRVNSQDTKQSPEMSKKGKAKQMKSPQNAPPDLDLPQSMVKQSVGITEAVHQFLEIVEIMGQMNPLFGFYHSHPGMAPYQALDQYVAQINNIQQMNGQMMQQAGPRTPGFGQFPMGASPNVANLQLPGSPHVGSPAPGAMQAPQMQLQQSQQGTSSSGPSANTSPAGTKRRRPSAVKNEDENAGNAPTPSGAGGAGQANGVQTKTKPPTPRMQKRVKGNPA